MHTNNLFFIMEIKMNSKRYTDKKKPVRYSLIHYNLVKNKF